MATRQPVEVLAEDKVLATGKDRPVVRLDLAGMTGEVEELGLDEDRSLLAYTDTFSAQLLGEALEQLAAIRSPFGPADPGAVLTALVSLCAEAGARLDDAVADARAAGYGWSAIAERLAAVNARAARRRYGAYCRWREEGCPLPIA
jgi:hypothetical protein